MFDGPEGGPPYIDFINPKNKSDGVILNIENKGTAANLVTWQQLGISESQVENLGKSFSFDTKDKLTSINALILMEILMVMLAEVQVNLQVRLVDLLVNLQVMLVDLLVLLNQVLVHLQEIWNHSKFH